MPGSKGLRADERPLGINDTQKDLFQFSDADIIRKYYAWSYVSEAESISLFKHKEKNVSRRARYSSFQGTMKKFIYCIFPTFGERRRENRENI